MNFWKTILGVVALSGCMTATETMEGYVGKDIREVMAKNGPPSNEFTTPDGRRAFQWHRNRDLYMPATTNVMATNYGASTYATATTSGGYMGSTPCFYTFYATRKDSNWIVVGIEKPSFSCN